MENARTTGGTGGDAWREAVAEPLAEEPPDAPRRRRSATAPPTPATSTAASPSRSQPAAPRPTGSRAR